MAPLGKSDLLEWAEETGGIRPCSKYADLRDGVVFLALADRLFPGSIDPRALRRGPIDVERNWDTLRRVMERQGLPVHLCDRNAISAGHTRHCFNMLVLFYFLIKLSHDSDFCVDFANPIDAKIAEFLQSPQSLRCVGKVPAGANATTEADLESCLGSVPQKKIQTKSNPNIVTKKNKVRTEYDTGSVSSVSCNHEDREMFTNEEWTRDIAEHRGRSIPGDMVRSIAEDRARSIAGDMVRSSAEDRARSIPGDMVRSIAEDRARSIAGDMVRSSAEDRARDIAVDRVRSIAEDRARSIAGDMVRSSAEDRARDIAVDRARSIAEDRARSIAGDMVRSSAEDRARSIAGDMVRSSAEDRARSIAGDMVRSSAEDRARSIPGDMVRSIAEDRARSIPGDMVRSSAEDRARSIPGDMVRSIAEDRARSIAGDMVRSSAEDRARDIAVDRVRSIAEDRARSIAGDMVRSSAEDRARSIAEDRARSIPGDMVRSIAEDRARDIAVDRVRSIAEDRARSIAGDMVRSSAEDWPTSDISMCIDGDEKQQLRASHAQLLAELDHVRAASRLALAQQRALVAAEVSRTTEQFEARLAVQRLECDHEARRRLIEARAQLDALAAAAPNANASASASAVQLRAVEADLRDARETAESLRAAVEAQRARHDAFARRVEAICAADEHSEWDSLDSAALRGAAVLRVRALSAECRALRDENERLRAGGCGLATPLDDAWDAGSESPLDADKPHDSSNGEGEGEAKGEGMCECPCGAGRRLARVSALLCARGAAARRALAAHRARLRDLHARWRAAESARAADAQRAQRTADAQRDELARHAEAVAAAAAAKVQAAEERCARREAMAAALHERASEMLSAVLAHARQAPALADLRAPLEALRAELRAGPPPPSGDAALREALREARGAAGDAAAALGRRDAEFGAADAARRAADERAARAEAEAAALRDAMAAEARELRGLLREFAHGNLNAEETAPQPPVASDAPDAQGPVAAVSYGRSLLSPDELERRKLEILGKYGFLATRQNRVGEH